jgi:hypothetical protein
MSTVKFADLGALSPLDPEDPQCRAWLLHLERRDFYLAKFFRGGENA